LKKRIVGITPGSMDKIVSYGWPGNVRQLENALKRAMVLCQGEWILEDHLLLEKGAEKEEPESDLAKRSFENLLDVLFEELSKTSGTSGGLDMVSIIEKGLIVRALQKTGGNQVQAAQLLGINRGTLRGKMERYSIKKEVLVSDND